MFQPARPHARAACLQGITCSLSLPAYWDFEMRIGWDEGQLAAELRRAWEECTDELERQASLIGMQLYCILLMACNAGGFARLLKLILPC